MICSSCVPLVKSTKPQNNSLKAIPFCVPPHAIKSQSATTFGTASDKTSSKNVPLLSKVPLTPAERLNASLIRLNSLGETKITKKKTKQTKIRKCLLSVKFNYFFFYYKQSTHKQILLSQIL